ncbi:KNL1 protein, partial [Scytalopus superciliaris]|nr:KNL1 protein [Scytalopus superciliaris]
MDKVYADPNMDNDNTEHVRGKRLSSILKAPRNPLDDLGNGNELTQDINIEKRRKSSRRVSFANTIKVFQRDLKNSTAERENTGMNTLLHAPIQALVQQAEWHEVDQAVVRINRQDTTQIFFVENEMEMTASHTAVISRNLRNQQADITEKIDITSFLAGLNSSQGKAEMSRECSSLPDLTNHSCPPLEQQEQAPAVKKINFNEFLLSLKSNEKAPNPAVGPDKENVFFVPSQDSENVALSPETFVYSHEPLNTCNITKVFQGQEGGMEMTKCQAADVKVSFPGVGSVSSETVFRGDKTVVFSKCEDMEMTGNYTDIISNNSTTEMNDCQNSGKQEQTHPVRAINKVLPTRVDSERHFPISKTISSGEDLQTPLSADGLQTGTSQPRRGSSQLSFFGGKSVVFPSGENMDLTGSCMVMVPDYTVNVVLSQTKAAPGYPDQDENEIIFASAEDMDITKTHTAQNPQPIPAIPADKTVVFALNQNDMEITASHTVAVNNDIDGFE